MFKRSKIIWTILIINENDWYINYIKNKLLYQINKNGANDHIEILRSNNISEVEYLLNISKGKYTNILMDEDISDNYIKLIYNALLNSKFDCLFISGVFYTKNIPKIFNQSQVQDPIFHLNIIKKDLVVNNISNYLNNNISINNKENKIEDLIIFKEIIPKEKISIIVTAYQVSEYIEECLDSIENQSYFKDNDKYEILVGVDHCEDTLKKLEQIKHKYRNLSIYMMNENRGTYITTNTLINLVKSEHVIRFDSDDIMDFKMVEKVMKYKGDNDILRLGYIEFENHIKERRVLVNDGIIYFKKSVMVNIIGGYMPWLCAADSELLVRVKNKVKISDIKEKLFYRRIHKNSLTNRKETSYNSDLRRNYIKQIKRYYNDDEIKIEKVISKPSINLNRIIKKYFSIVIPTMWCSDKIFKMLPIYNDSEFIKEIIIIDNDPSKKMNVLNYDKLRYYPQKENIYVNPSWNLGYSLSNYELILANDDIIIDDFDDVMELISQSDKDIIGIDIRKNCGKITIEDIDVFPANSYGCFMYIKNYTYIPDQFKIWYGDSFLFNFNKKRGILKNIKISTNKSETIDANENNSKQLRFNIGENDVKLYSNLIKSDSNSFNIIIRTSGRPIYFNNCIKSIRKYYPDAKLHITIDNIDDINYVENCLHGFEYNYYLINKFVIENICKKINIERTPFIYNYYFNVVRPYLNGWCYYLDDDDILLTNPEFNKNNKNNIYLYKVDIGTKIVPSKLNFGNPPVLNDISTIGIILHSSKLIDWLPQRGGDYSFISTIYKNSDPIWNDVILSKTQTGGNFGKRNDLTEFDKPITVNMATYPPRKESFIKVINNLLEIDIIDKIRIYLNEYTNIPEEFPKTNKILYKLGDNLKDSGKYFWSNSFKNEYYFTLDDDLIYPKSFFINHILMLDKYNNEIFITTHGKEMVDNPRVFNEYKKSYHCLKNVETDEWINNGGTGVMAFDNSKFIIPIELFEYHGMADLWISLYSQKNKIPILCRKHTSDELKYIEQEDTLFDRRNEMKNEHQIVLDLIGTWKLYKK